jgi:phage terminase large subunit-like protein
LISLPSNIRPKVIAALPPRDLVRLLQDFPLYAHRHQLPADRTVAGVPWRTWLLIGGRGSGKTRAGAEWVKAQAEAGVTPIALVGESAHDAREVMIEGVSGLMSLYLDRAARPTWIPSRHRLEWPRGQVAYAFSAEDPESLRGPQFAAAWCDELAKWKRATDAFDMLQFGLRLGECPRQVITTTPRPTALIKQIESDPATVVTRAGTQANKYHLAAAFLDAVTSRYGGTRLGRQEIDGEIVEERADALWSRALIERCRVAERPPLQRTVVAVDPPASSGKGADACGIVAAGRAADGTIYVIADETMNGLTPAAWSRRAIDLWRRLEADALVVEVNQGGEMVRAVMRSVDAAVPVTEARAMKGKWLRAEPIAALYEQGRVKHAGTFPALEDEMCDFGLGGLSSGQSPDRLDAMVWAVTSLTHGAWQGPRVRML